MDVETVCDELYGLPLEEFIPARARWEQQAKAAGDKDLAVQIHRLAKPNLVAWLANQLAREHADEMLPLIELGAGLRQATATQSGEQLRELSRQQRQLVSALVQQARGLAKAGGRTVSQDTARALEDTLRAALADPDAAERLTAGCLTRELPSSGFGGFGGIASTGEALAGTGEPSKASAALQQAGPTSKVGPKDTAPQFHQAERSPKQDWARERFSAGRVARLATSSPDGGPHLVPVVFAVLGDVVWTAVDAKPKSTRSLRRLANIDSNPRVSLLVDHYEEDWSALWWVRVDGNARIVPALSAEGAAGVAALVEKYAQYHDEPPPGPVVVIEVDVWRSWSASDRTPD